jgi:beta-galactosidase
VPLVDVAGLLGPERSFDSAPTHDDVGAWDGFVLYRTRVEADDAVLAADEVRDRAIVALDGEPVGVLDRASHAFAVPLPRRAGELTLLVEDQGRVNYGSRIGEPKGLIGAVRTATRELTGWQVRPLRFDDGDALSAPVVEALRAASPVAGGGVAAPLAGPVLAHGVFDSAGGADHFLRLDGWTKGLVWVNGFCLGRYWSAGPARTMYVPGPLVRDEGNEVVVLELHGAARGVVDFVAAPDLGHTEE